MTVIMIYKKLAICFSKRLLNPWYYFVNASDEMALFMWILVFRDSGRQMKRRKRKLIVPQLPPASPSLKTKTGPYLRKVPPPHQQAVSVPMQFRQPVKTGYHRVEDLQGDHVRFLT